MRDLLSIVFLVAVLLIAPLGANSPYFVITPGGTWDIGSRLRIPEDRKQAMGRMAFTAVFEQEANWAEVARVRLQGQAEVVPANDVRPPGATQQQINETNRRLIDESKPVAAVVGLRAAGYDVEITGQGAEVQGVVAGAPAQGVLQVGDIITAADGQPTPTTTALVELIGRHKVGDQIDLTVTRNGQPVQVRVGTRNSPAENGRPQVGVSISTHLFDVRLPFPVDIASDDVGGPSAGFMFALGILDAVTAGDLTRGHFVTGTGTIGTDGVVGPIGGAAEKALAAEREGSDVFLVPAANAEDARRWTHNIQVVPIQRFEDGIKALCALPPKDQAAAETPTPCQ